MGIKDEELEGLSDEERAALEDDDDESEILKTIAGDDGDDSDDDEGQEDDGKGSASDDGDNGAADAAGEGKSSDGDTDADDGGLAVAEAPVVTEEFHPEFKASAPENLTDRLAELDQKESDIEKKFDDGEIDRDEMRKQLKVISEERQDLKIADALAKQAGEQNADIKAQRWQWEQERFFATEKASIYKNESILAALNVEVKKLANDSANAKKPASFFLEEADRQVRKLFGMGDAPLKAVKQAGRQPDLSKVPKTLAQLPAAEMAETGDVEFAYLEKLEGMDLERALRKLTPEQEARYLGAAA